MEFVHASIALLASMALVLAGMVGWLYWQQTRLFQNMNSIVMVIGEIVRPMMTDGPKATPPEEEVRAPPPSEAGEEDDRVSIQEEEEEEEALDTDGLESKTKKELQDLLSKRGIPYGRGDSKTVLVSLLKATA